MKSIFKGGYIMKRAFVLFLLLMPILILSGCSRNSTSTEVPAPTDIPAPSAAVQADVINANNIFGLKLFQRLSDEKPDGNVVISPLSISLAFGMALNGADGQTYTDMQSTLELAGLTPDEVNATYRYMLDFLDGLDPLVMLEIANSMWIEETFDVRQEFIDMNTATFDAEVRKLPFNPKAVNIINTWIAEKTHDKITDALQTISPAEVLFLINAVYFKGTWTYQFDSTETIDADFHMIDGTTTACRLMHQENEFLHYSDQSVQVVDLPYGDGDFSLTVIFPNPDITVDDIIAGLDNDLWNQWIDGLEMDSGTVYLPKFKIEYTTSLIPALADMGMNIAFAPRAADFKKITTDMNIYISGALHKTFIEVNEEGTEAAAVTVIGYESISNHPSYFAMYIDRPFLIAIREKVSGTILFMGKILKPTT